MGKKKNKPIFLIENFDINSEQNIDDAQNADIDNDSIRTSDTDDINDVSDASDSDGHNPHKKIKTKTDKENKLNTNKISKNKSNKSKNKLKKNNKCMVVNDNLNNTSTDQQKNQDEENAPKKKPSKKNREAPGMQKLSKEEIDAVINLFNKNKSDQSEISNSFLNYINELDWKIGLKKTEISKYKKIWNFVCKEIVEVPLISDILKLNIDIREKSEFIHRLMVLYSYPLDSMEFIQLKKSLNVQYKKYQHSKLSAQEIKQYEEAEKKLYEALDYKLTLKHSILKSNMSEKNKAYVFSRYLSLANDTENTKLKTWIQNALSVPNNLHNIFTNNSVPGNIDDFLYNIHSILNQNIYGMQNVKEQLLFLINNKISNQNYEGAAIALEGLPGIGKTCIVNALAKALNLPMASIKIGGAKDVHFLTGHGYTYEGSLPGAIVQALQQLKCKNGIIFIDEIDKIPHDDKGSEISKALLHIIDPSQNFAFHDRYLSSQFDIDLSKIWFIYTLNNKAHIEKTLRDRIPIIQVPGYTRAEKIQICKEYLVPKSLEQHGIKKEEVKIDTDAIKYLINLVNDSKLEIADKDGRSGVRQLKYAIDQVVMKINLLKNIMTNDGAPKLKLSFNVKNFKIPIVVTPDVINQLKLNLQSDINSSIAHLYM